MTGRFVATLLLLLAAVTPSYGADCTSEQQAALDALPSEPTKCFTQTTYFKVCDDDCHAHFELLAKQTPTCKNEFGTEKSPEFALKDLERCNSYRPMAADKYMPRLSVGVRKCTDKESDSRKSFAPFTDLGEKSLYNECARNATKKTVLRDKSCSAECLKVIEDKITQATPCVYDAYPLGEVMKSVLVECINLRDNNLKGNTVLQTVLGGDNSTTPNQASASASESTPSPSKDTPKSSAVAVSVSVLSGIVVISAVSTLWIL